MSENLATVVTSPGPTSPGPTPPGPTSPGATSLGATSGGPELSLYSRVSHLGASRIIHEYSTSFGMATRLLAPSVRPQVENIYALVRIADEIVDGAAAQSGLSTAEQRDVLDALEADTERALRCGYSANIVVHAFAQTARQVGIGTDLTAPFFASMRRDLDPVDFTSDELNAYIYGSAEVVGLMCLRAFLADAPGVTSDPELRARLEKGARHLGAAFQKINFLRDLAVDWAQLGRNYFPGIDPAHVTDRQKLDLVVDIDSDLDAAAAVIPALPDNCRRAIGAAHALFSELSDRIRATPARTLVSTRVRVPARAKFAILVRAGTGIGSR